jgi:hypothetical protein
LFVGLKLLVIDFSLLVDTDIQFREQQLGPKFSTEPAAKGGGI